MFRLSLLSNYSQFSVPFTIRHHNWLEFGLLIACLVHVIQSVSAAGFIVSGGREMDATCDINGVPFVMP